MTGRRAAALAALGFGATVLVAWALTGSPETHLAFRLAGAATATAAAVVLLGHLAAGERRPDAFHTVWWRGAGASGVADPPERESLHRLVRLASGSADIAHKRLRPVLRDLADAHFEAAYGTHPDQDALAAERFGPVAWEWLRPDRREPDDRHAPGPTPAELDAVVTTIEQLGDGGGERR